MHEVTASGKSFISSQKLNRKILMPDKYVKNLAQILDESSARLPDKICLIYEDTRLTYKELNELVNRSGNAFADLGVKKGDRVIVSLLNCPEFIVAFFALAKIGAISVPINYLLAESEEQYILKDSEADLIITDRAKLPNFRKMTAGTIPIVITDRRESDKLLPGTSSFWKLIEKHSPILSPSPCTREDVVNILYTSGTTGKPKGAMLTHYSVMFCSSLYSDNDDTSEVFSEKAKFLTSLPLYHCYGQNPGLITPLSVGATVILLERFDTVKVLEAIGKHSATHFPGVPTMYAYLINAFDPIRHDISSLEFCCSAGAALSSEVANEFQAKIGVEIIEGYGITEASAQAIAHPLTPDKRRKDKFGSIGRPLKNSTKQTEAKIVDENGRELPPGEAGELVIKGDHLMKGYWKLPEETRQTIRDGWLYTGDIAKRDEDGYFYIVDRKKDMIIVGGENVYPREVEEVLYQNEKILEVAVVGRQDKVKGESVRAVVALKRDCRATEKELIDFCSSRLAKFKVPQTVEIREELPKSSTGKILRRLLR